MSVSRALLLALMLQAWVLHPGSAKAAEVCHFTGTTDYDGHVAVTTEVSETVGLIRVDVAVKFDATTLLWLPISYKVEEVSTWRGETLESVAVNTRQFAGGRIVRQQWDVFDRAPGGLLARRVQAKTLADFRARHPGFVRHWDPATFAVPWLGDYPEAAAERREDLDLPGAPPPGLRSPLALAFYWVRFLPPGGRDVPVFLPGFKTGRLVELPITATPAGGAVRWQTPLHHPALSEQLVSTATAWTSPDPDHGARHLLQLAFELHGSAGSATGLIRQEGCRGNQAGE